MIVFYLVVAILMTNGKRPPTLTANFDTLEECNAEGVARSVEIVANKDVKSALWSCISADFSKDKGRNDGA